MGKKVLNSSYFARINNSCKKRKLYASKKIDIESKKTTLVLNDIARQILLESIHDDILRTKSTKDLEAYLVKRITNTCDIKDLTFPTRDTKNKRINHVTKDIARYLLSETRYCVDPMAIISDEPELVNVAEMLVSKSTLEMPDFDFDLSATADAIYISQNPLVSTKTIHLIKYRFGKKTAYRKSKKNELDNLELKIMIAVADSLIPKTYNGGNYMITASYYYTRKETDRVSDSKYHYDENFFNDDSGKATNNTVTVTLATNNRDDFYDAFEEELTKFSSGSFFEHNCNSKDCENCVLSFSCNFNKPPIIVEKEQKTTPLSSINLDAPQQEFIDINEGLIRCNAGAGSGKTTVLALKAVKMISEGINPKNILLLTYTNNAAKEMKDRVNKYLNEFGMSNVDLSEMTCTTFNAFCNECVLEQFSNLNYTSAPRVIDFVKKVPIIARILNTNNQISGFDYENFDNLLLPTSGAKVLARAFDIIKNEGLTKGDEETLQAKMHHNYRSLEITKEGYSQILDLYEIYENILISNNLLEFADQELKFFDILDLDPYYLDKKDFRYIIVDEFQDSSKRQLDLLVKLTECENFKMLAVVGDDSQAIYSFRDTTPEYMINFFSYFDEAIIPNANRHDIYMTKNFRCQQNIIDLANNYIKHNKTGIKKDLIATRPAGTDIELYPFEKKNEEFEFIGSKVQEYINKGYPLGSIAVLLPNKSNINKVCTVLTEKGIQWITMNPMQLISNSRVQAGIAFIKAVNNPTLKTCVVEYVNCLLDNILFDLDKEEIDKLIYLYQQEIEYLSKVSSLNPDKVKMTLMAIEALNYHDDEIMSDFIDRLKFEKNFIKLVNFIDDFEKYGEEVAVRRVKNYPGVVITTYHSAKGLEWDNLIMSTSDIYKGLNYNEEIRRLMFVGVTRAKNNLVITGVKNNGTIKEPEKNLILEEFSTILNH